MKAGELDRASDGASGTRKLDARATCTVVPERTWLWGAGVCSAHKSGRTDVGTPGTRLRLNAGPIPIAASSTGVWVVTIELFDLQQRLDYRLPPTWAVNVTAERRGKLILEV